MFFAKLWEKQRLYYDDNRLNSRDETLFSIVLEKPNLRFFYSCFRGYRNARLI